MHERTMDLLLPQPKSGFTLVELSIVIVIIGLIVGGVLVGRDLIAAAEVRSQISQIEKYHTAVKTFRLKYGALPGDIAYDVAQQVGLSPGEYSNGYCRGGRDGNGVIEGINGNQCNVGAFGTWEGMGETALFWVDLTQGNGTNNNFIDGSFSAGASISNITPTITSANIDSYFPKGKMGKNYVYVWSSNSKNYFGISNISTSGSWTVSSPGITVQQAYNIDNKIDDGTPLTGSVTAQYVNGNPTWGGTANGTTAVSPSTTTCYDNGANTSNTVIYSTSKNSGNGINCALSFQFM